MTSFMAKRFGGWPNRTHSRAVESSFAGLALLLAAATLPAQEFPKPYSAPCTEREDVFEFTERPAVRRLAEDAYEISFAVKGYCDVTVSILDEKGTVLRHLGSGVLGSNAPAPFQKNALKQRILWNGKDDMLAYVKEPDKMSARVVLGLKPVFDKRLGGTSPYNLPARILGLGADPEGVYVLTKGARAKWYLRKYDLDGRYLASLLPPPANLPVEKLQGMGYIEYEKGQRALHGRDLYETTGKNLCWPGLTLGKYLAELQPAVTKGRIYLLTSADRNGDPLWYLKTDGSTDLAGLTQRTFFGPEHTSPRLAPSPDGRWLYMTGVGPAVLRLATEGTDPAKVWLGDLKAPGSDEKRFNDPQGLACDAQGRLYVCDHHNSRLSVFSPEGSPIGSIPVERPWYVCVHQKTGVIYVQHDARSGGQTLRRVSKLASLEKPEVLARLDGPMGVMALDSWSARPRLWIANVVAGVAGTVIHVAGNGNLQVFEDQGTAFKRILDFDEKMKAEEGEFGLGALGGVVPPYLVADGESGGGKNSGRWGGGYYGGKVVCDPTRERVYFNGNSVFDLKTGTREHVVVIPGSYDDLAFDKRGYLHCHFNPGFNMPGVGRLDPSRSTPYAPYGKEVPGHRMYAECPYDYGEERERDGRLAWRGILPVKDQKGPKFFQDGIGVNMWGDVAEVCNVWHVPKMDEFSAEIMLESAGDGANRQEGFIGKNITTTSYLREVREAQKRGEEVYFVKRRPGIPLMVGTIWTFEQTGELRQECAVLAGLLINGVQMDEERHLYYVAGKTGNTRMLDGKPFLQGRHGLYGRTIDSSAEYIFTGTLIKTAGERATLLLRTGAAVPLDQPPQRPLDVSGGWIEGAEWLYAGASPIVSDSCSCPTQRSHLDWYQRMFVPEQYRHSIGILDTGGNLVLHLGRYGNFDSGHGPKSRIAVGGDEIALCAVRFVSGTDNYLVFEDNGERLVVLKLDGHTVETVPVKAK